MFTVGRNVVEWKERTLQHWQTINALAVRRFGPGSLAEEAALTVIDGLAAGEWRRVRGYAGRASFAAYIRAVTTRLLEDFARRRFGRRRPPLWLQTFGGFWLRLFQALCLERLPPHEAVERVKQSCPDESQPCLESAAFEILARIPDCGITQGQETELGEDVAAPDGDGGDISERRQQEELLRAISALILGQPEPPPADIWQRYRDININLHPQEILLLRLCFQDGLSVAEAGERLGLGRFQAHGRMRRLLKRLREELTRCGLAEALGFSPEE